VEFLTKPFSDEALLSAIRLGIERSRAVLGQKAEMQELQRCYASLTRREQQVMSLVVSGLLNKQVGGGARHQRDHCESPPRPGDAENESRFPRRLGENGRQAWGG
jgi:hypothetical protein